MTAERARDIAHQCRISPENVHVEVLFARALLEQRIETLEECAKAACKYCREGEHLLSARNQGRIVHESFYACHAQYEQSAIAKTRSELMKLKDKK